MSKDFTLSAYKSLLEALQRANYSFFTFEDWCDGKADGRYVILRHDVDLKADHSLAIAKIEAEMGIRASYYFRIVPQSNQPEIIKSIADLNHEIGYHYEDLSLFGGDTEKSIIHFKNQLQHFRQFYPVRTICMHGSPTSKFDNRFLWKEYNYRDYGIIGEPYFDFLGSKNSDNGVGEKVMYITDTGRMWDGDKYNIRDKVSNRLNDNNIKSEQPQIHSTLDFINWLNSNPKQSTLMITTHPQRWTDNIGEWLFEFIAQTMKNTIKRLITSRSKK